MPKAYWVVTYRSSVKNTEAWGAYAKLAAPALTAGGELRSIRMPKF